LLISDTRTPITFVFPLAKLVATLLGTYSSLSIILSTLIFVFSLTSFVFLLITLETVAIDTPASLATSYILTMMYSLNYS